MNGVLLITILPHTFNQRIDAAPEVGPGCQDHERNRVMRFELPLASTRIRLGQECLGDNDGAE